MITKAIIEAQRYLISNDGLYARRMIDIVKLSKNHDRGQIMLFLINLYKEKKKALEQLIDCATSAPELDYAIGALFRINMALKLLRTELEEEEDAEFKQRTAAGR